MKGRTSLHRAMAAAALLFLGGPFVVVSALLLASLLWRGP